MGYHNATCGCAACGNYGQSSGGTWIHNPTCGCAECRNYGQIYNPKAIHNQSCGCAECGNYEQRVPTPRPVLPVSAVSSKLLTPEEVASHLKSLTALKKVGILTKTEFQQKKKELLGRLQEQTEI